MELLPFAIARGISMLILTICVFVAAAHVTMTAWAAERSSLSPGARRAMPLLVAAFLAMWLAVGITTGDHTHYPLSDDENVRRLVTVAVGFGPMLVAIAALFSSARLRAVNDATPSEWLVRVQAYRMAGLMFLFPMLAYGVLPAAFAVPAAIGDFATGLAAPAVAAALERRRPYANALAVGWNLFGILDLVVAPASAVLSHARILDIYPLVLVPLFVGPPLGILTHVLSLRNLASHRRGTQRATPSLGGATASATP